MAAPRNPVQTEDPVHTDDTVGQVSLKHWGEPPEQAGKEASVPEAVVDCGWGRLIFGQTFDKPDRLAETIGQEGEDRRDVAFYVREPHVVLSCAPQTLFLDPSHTFRLDFAKLAEPVPAPAGFMIRPAEKKDEPAINAIYLSHDMVPLPADYLAPEGRPDSVTILAAQADETGEIIGVVMGVDHVAAFRDPDNGSSLWSLAASNQAELPGIGEALTLNLADYFHASGRSFMDLSVMHDNEQAIGLYQKLGFEQVPVYAVKKKNPINEKLFIGPAPEENLNIYAKLIVDEARRRGIAVEIDDAEAGFFTLSFGGRRVSCRESLSDLTSAVALSRCDDKRLTSRVLKQAGLSVPEQITVGSMKQAVTFFARHKRVVVKPARGEQGRGVFVDLRTRRAVEDAVKRVRELSDTVIMEECVPGDDLRIIVIDGEVVAAAMRRPARIIGDGTHSIRTLIDKQSRRRASATGGESRIPLDEETERCVRKAGYKYTDILPEGEALEVRRTANLHTGGTIHDVTDDLHETLADAALEAARALDIPVAGLDLAVSSADKPGYYIIEANERPGLANHEPQPTAERFVDFLFPQTRVEPRRAAE